jgi:SAM-dependent methyltransferase
VKTPHPLPITRCSTLEELNAFLAMTASHREEIAAFEGSLVPNTEWFSLSGYCEVCARDVQFTADYAHCFIAADGKRSPNWREKLDCPHCGLNNRMRAAVGFIQHSAKQTDSLYLTEQITPMFRVVKSLFPRTLGSEFIPHGIVRGGTDGRGIRHEDVTNLTLASRSIDLIGTFDVLEHVPDYRRAIQEFVRCLRPGGTLVMTVPFALASPVTVARARVMDDGSIQHLLPPEYHGDPLSSAGILSYYDFGWDLLNTFTEEGLVDQGLYFYWSYELGYLGQTQFVIKAQKPL